MNISSDISTNKLGVEPTLYLIGLNRSGTTALMQSFLNHPEVEVFKEPGKYKYESSGEIDFFHFFKPPIFKNTKARVIKQTVGQYTPDLCTIPLYPNFKNKPLFIKKIHSLFLIRQPSAIWNSWETMTYWLQITHHPYIKEKNRKRERDHGIKPGWGSFSLFRLAYLYFFETYKYIHKIAPNNVSVISLEDLVNTKINKKILTTLCNKIGLDFTENMIFWKYKFGENNSRLVDGIRRSINNIERQFIHRNVIASSTFRKVETERIISNSMVREIDNGELGNIYKKLLALSRKEFHINNL